MGYCCERFGKGKGELHFFLDETERGPMFCVCKSENESLNCS